MRFEPGDCRWPNGKEELPRHYRCFDDCLLLLTSTLSSLQQPPGEYIRNSGKVIVTVPLLYDLVEGAIQLLEY